MVELTNENSLLEKIGDLAENRKIQNTVGLTAQDAKAKIEKLIPTTRQRISATRFCLNLIEHIDFDFYLGIQTPSQPESETLTPLKHFGISRFGLAEILKLDIFSRKLYNYHKFVGQDFYRNTISVLRPVRHP